MKKVRFCVLSLLLLPALLLPTSANSAPTRYGGIGGSVLEIQEDCPITVTAEQLTFDVSEWDGVQLSAQVTAVYQMKNPTSDPCSVQMAFYLDEYDGQVGPPSPADWTDLACVTADGIPLDFSARTVSPDGEDAGRTALVYTVDFPAEDSREVAVSYQSYAYACRDGTSHWTQEFTYLLSPARYWADFGTLDLTVNTPESCPYLVDASLPLEADGDFRYTAHFDTLPETELTFTLYPKPEITLLDRAQAALSAFLSSAAYLFAFFWPVLLILAVFLILLAVRLTLRRSRRKGR
jgi:hypothetical protein